MKHLEWIDVTAGYGDGTVLHGVSIAVGEGESIAVIGRNGAGKSTLMHTLYGIPRIRSGRIEIGGFDVTRARPYKAAFQGVALAPQGRRILPNLTVEENLLMGAASKRRGRWTIQTVYELFPILSERRKKLGTQLSGGQQQMLTVGRALMANPTVLLLDEPSEGLAPVIVDELAEALNLVRASGVGLVIVEQHLGLVSRIADHFVLLEKGEVKHRAPVSHLDTDEVRALLAL